MLRICTVNVNGVRAAARRGGMAWLTANPHDVVLMQEVRANDSQLVAATAELGEHHLAHAASDQAGRSGVAIVSKRPLTNIRVGVGPDSFATSGRWVEATITDDSLGEVTVVSVYVHSGEADTPKQEEKYRFLTAMTHRLGELLVTGQPTLVTGDFNIAHTERDIRNAKGNRNKAGFLPAERDYLSSWLAAGWVDTGRAHAGDVDGPYTWWSWRGQAFDRDTGWRIDYAYATPDLAARLVDASVGKAATYAERWSDHAPVSVAFDG